MFLSVEEILALSDVEFFAYMHKRRHDEAFRLHTSVDGCGKKVDKRLVDRLMTISDEAVNTTLEHPVLMSYTLHEIMVKLEVLKNTYTYDYLEVAFKEIKTKMDKLYYDKNVERIFITD